MATIVTKNSSTASAVPTTSDLVQGELAVNVTDKRIFTENASTQIVELGTNPSTVTTATATVTGTLTANGTFASSNAVITGGTINSTPIGATTPSTIVGSTVTANTGFVGGLTGNVTGNLTGNVTGNVTGDLTGNVTGNVTASSGTTTLNDLVVNGTADFTNTKLTNVVTPTAGTDAANKSYVDDTVAAVIDSAPAALDTLNELAAALGDDANFAGTVTTALATKLPLAGGTMTGAIAMGTAKITGLGDPTSAQDAATKTYVDTADALKLSLTGGTMSGAIAMGTNKITGVGDPTLAQDAATKAYTDSILGSATSAADSAAAAATSASNAATSASNAASSATTASNAVTSAELAATNAAASYDSFDDRYLGAKASDPTLDNDGDALVEGALYFNTTSDAMKVYDGASWVNVAPVATSVTVSQISDYTGDATTLNYTSGLTSDAQTQIDGKEPADATILKDADIGSTVQAYDSNLTSFVGTFTLPTTDGTTGQVLSTNGTGTLSLTSVSSYTDADVDTHLNTATASSGEMLSWNGSDYDWVAGGGLLGDTDSGSPYLTAVGYNSNTNVTGTFNTVVGYHITAPSITGDYNTTVGTNAGTALTSGESNVFIGYGAGDSVTTGSKNTAISSALTFLTSGLENVAVGWQSLAVQTSGNGNVAVGVRAGDAVTNGSQLTLIGTDAGGAITTGQRNTAIGYEAGLNITNNNDNTFVGHYAGRSSGSSITRSAFIGSYAGQNSSAADTVAIGYSAYQISNGDWGVAVGTNALYNTSGIGNVAAGYYAGNGVTSGVRGVYAGFNAGRSITTGDRNVCIGDEAGRFLGTQAYNVCIGYRAGYSNPSYGSVCIGSAVNPSSGSSGYEIVIGDFITGVGGQHITMGNSSGKVYCSYTSSATWTQTSDASMKRNIQSDSLGLSFINRLNPVTFNWIPNNELPTDHPYYNENNGRNAEEVIHGLIAQEVKQAMADEDCLTFNGWNEESNGIQGISREMFVTPLIKAVQELSSQVEELKAELSSLKGA